MAFFPKNNIRATCKTNFVNFEYNSVILSHSGSSFLLFLWVSVVGVFIWCFTWGGSCGWIVAFVWIHRIIHGIVVRSCLQFSIGIILFTVLGLILSCLMCFDSLRWMIIYSYFLVYTPILWNVDSKIATWLSDFVNPILDCFIPVLHMNLWSRSFAEWNLRCSMDLVLRASRIHLSTAGKIFFLSFFILQK